MRKSSRFAGVGVLSIAGLAATSHVTTAAATPTPTPTKDVKSEAFSYMGAVGSNGCAGNVRWRPDCRLMDLDPSRPLVESVVKSSIGNESDLRAIRTILENKRTELAAKDTFDAGAAPVTIADPVERTRLDAEMVKGIALVDLALTAPSEAALLLDAPTDASLNTQALDYADAVGPAPLEAAEGPSGAGRGWLENSWVWRANEAHQFAYCDSGGDCSYVTEVYANYRLALNGGQMQYSHTLYKPFGTEGSFQIHQNWIDCRRDKFIDEDCSGEPHVGPYEAWTTSVDQSNWDGYDGGTSKKFLNIQHNIEVSQAPGDWVNTQLFTSYRWSCTSSTYGPQCKFTGAS